jgi:hypothetical protein
MRRRGFRTTMLAGTVVSRHQWTEAQGPPGEAFFEPAAAGTLHRGKVLSAVQAHTDGISLLAAGTVAKLVYKDYMGCMVHATNDDMGDAPGPRASGTIAQYVLRNERDNESVARVLGLERVFNLNYSNHRKGGVSQNELQGSGRRSAWG